MAKVFQAGIYSSSKTIYEGAVSSLIAPLESGFWGILADHAPLAARLKKGKISIKDGNGLERSIEISRPGLIEVLNNNVTILLS